MKSCRVVLNPRIRGFASFVGVSNGRVQSFIGGRFVDTEGAGVADVVINPATAEKIAETPNSSSQQIDAAIKSAKSAFPAWRQTPVSKRMRCLIKLHQLIDNQIDNLAILLTTEQGKTLADSKGDISRGLDVVEHMLAAPTLLTGSTSAGVSQGMDAQTLRVPRGVCVGITPFNFPAMIPLWMFPTALVAGNTFVLKPSARVPLTAMKLMELCGLADIPPGVVNCVHGQKEVVEHLCSHQDTQAISFVGGNIAGRAIYEIAGKHGKPAQCNMGAKNHAVILADANPQKALTAVCNAAFGAAGQRCMAVSVVVLVGDAIQWEAQLVEIARHFKVGNGMNSQVDLGPMVSSIAKQRAVDLCRESVSKFGSSFLLDGTSLSVSDSPNGFFFGPTILSDVTIEAPVYTQELFAPVLAVMKAATLDDAIRIINGNSFGNGCAIFTNSGNSARHFSSSVNVGQVGVNVPIPVPPSIFSFTGWGDSMAGDAHLCGTSALHFYSKTQTVLSRWDSKPDEISGAFPSLR